jgi:nucleoside-diphosphate-sugar epimerase
MTSMANIEAVVGADDLIVVAGAGGFIGGHLIATLRKMGYRRLRAVDIKPVSVWFQRFEDVDNRVLDLRQREACLEAAAGAAAIVNLACDMGGMGFIESHKVECMLSVLINTHLLMAADAHGCRRYLYSSSACVYNQTRQDVPDVAPLREEDAYPALAEDGYGWEKLFSERMCRHFTEDRGLATRVVRLHNVYGPLGTYDGGREKAPAALSRKVATAKLGGLGEIEIWGDGLQTRSFMYIDDCVDGLLRIFASECGEPLNLGSAEMVTINGLADMVEDIAGVRLARRHEMDRPKGVRGRSSDNTLIRTVLGWEPSTSLRTGLAPTYAWIEREIREGGSPVFRMS